MARANSQNRLDRLKALAAELKADRLHTAQSLAELFDVSARTITRDLRLLRDQGLPIDADRGRGGGVRLDRNWGVGRLNLSYAEAVDLLISIAVAEQMQSEIFLANLSSIKRQIIASLSPDKKERAKKLKSRILIGVTASTFVQSNIVHVCPSVIRPLHQSFVEQTRLAIDYKAEVGRASHRQIEPHYLLLNYPAWYVIAFDHLRDAPRTFRCDRILSARCDDTRFRLAPLADFEQSLEGNELLK